MAGHRPCFSSGAEEVPASAELPFLVPWIVDSCHDGFRVFDMFVAAKPGKNEDFDNDGR